MNSAALEYHVERLKLAYRRSNGILRAELAEPVRGLARPIELAQEHALQAA